MFALCALLLLTCPCFDPIAEPPPVPVPVGGPAVPAPPAGRAGPVLGRRGLPVRQGRAQAGQEQELPLLQELPLPGRAGGHGGGLGAGALHRIHRRDAQLIFVGINYTV